jgi:hypothetical protein
MCNIHTNIRATLRANSTSTHEFAIFNTDSCAQRNENTSDADPNGNSVSDPPIPHHTDARQSLSVCLALG